MFYRQKRCFCFAIHQIRNYTKIQNPYWVVVSTSIFLSLSLYAHSQPLYFPLIYFHYSEWTHSIDQSSYGFKEIVAFFVTLEVDVNHHDFVSDSLLLFSVMLFILFFIYRLDPWLSRDSSYVKECECRCKYCGS